MKINLLPLLFVTALFSIGDAFLKSYPVFFVIFMGAYLLSGGRLHRQAVSSACVFLVMAVLFSLVHIDKVFDLVSFVKLVLNVTFFVFATSYLLTLPHLKAVGLFRIAATGFISASFLQAFFAVYAGGLWLLPIQQENSSTSYILGEILPMVFGDLNKNIWASKVAIFLMITVCCQYIIGRPRFGFFVVLSIGLFTLFYVSSRTAQIAFIVFLGALFFHYFWIIKRRKFFLVLLAFVSLPVAVDLLQLIIRLDYNALVGFDASLGAHMGDGLLSRLIIWTYVVHVIDVADFFWGNGILSFSYYTYGVFSENNPHNVFLGLLMDFGIFTLCAYVYLLWQTFGKSSFSWLMLAPFMVFANSQYLGYDADLITFLVFVFVLGSKYEKLLPSKSARS